MRVALTGGCTGGHIYPALAIGDKFRQENAQNEVIFVGHALGLETSIVPSAGYELKIITADWVRRDNPIRMLKTILNTAKGKREAVKVLREFKPDVLVSTGSFVSVPVVMAAHSLKIPIYMHEQNGFPGVSNRAFAKWANTVFLGFEAAKDYFKIDSNKLVYSGNPVREEFTNRNQTLDRKDMGLPDKETVITIFGGSLGSETTNKIGEALIKEYGNKKGFVIIFGTGKEYYDEVRERLKSEGFGDCKNVRLMPYISEMAKVLSASDLVISRAGALSVAEVTMTSKAAIFVPSPNVTADHQYYNAKPVADAGGAVIVRESDETEMEVLRTVRKLAGDKKKLQEMGQNSVKIAPTNATEIIYKTIMETYK